MIERNVGDIVRGRNLGYKSTSHQWVRHACIVCGTPRWVLLRKGRPQNERCPLCARADQTMERHPYWKGGRVETERGYIKIRLSPDDFFYPMTHSAGRKGYVFEHRLVMARHLGRCLQPYEVVHHKDGDKTNNRIPNLELNTKNTHASDHAKGYHNGYIKGLHDGRLAQIKQLHNQIAELQTRLTTSQ